MNKQTNLSPRYENLDYLRGLCALSILFYHYTYWTMQGLDISNLLAKFGVYGVSLFYILSGLTMYLVYFKKFEWNSVFFKEFYSKRFFRLFPLMWLVFILAFLLKGYDETPYSLFIKISGLFSIIAWDAPVPVGMWSIGNEISFYLALPILFYCLKKGIVPTICISLLVFGFYIYYAYQLNDYIYKEDFDCIYKHPLYQLGLFFGGILIGHIFKTISLKNTWTLLLLLVSVVLYAFHPVNGKPINIMINDVRIYYTLVCFAITIAFFKANFSFVPYGIKKVLAFFGDISYSVYLLHSLVWLVFVSFGLKIRYVYPLSLVSTIFISWLVYTYFETPIRNIGIKFNTKINKQ